MSGQKFNLDKNNWLVIIILSIIIFSTGCSSRGHLKFQGIPINGTLESFTEELKNIGYKEAKAEREDQIKFSGRFLDRDCNVYLSTTNKSKTPYMVRVDFQKEHHDSIKYSYERFKKHCASILGPGASKYQQFSYSSRFLFNEPKLAREPKNGDYTRYLGSKGSVFLEVRYDYLSIIYLDKRNNELLVSEGGKKLNLQSGKEF